MRWLTRSLRISGPEKRQNRTFHAGGFPDREDRLFFFCLIDIFARSFCDNTPN
jgi:hypothetical protein